MFNTNKTIIHLGSTKQEITFNNTSTGMMQKSNANSTFIRIKKGDAVEKILFPTNGDIPYIQKFYQYDNSKKYEQYKDTDGKIEVTVLQVLIFGNDEYLIEILENKFFNEKKEEL